MTNYIIKQGEHSSSHGIKFYTGKSNFQITAIFYESCMYDLGDSDQENINKLCGISFGNHQKNSIRIGWNYSLVTKKIRIFYYLYENSVRRSEEICSVNVGDVLSLSLRLETGANYFIIFNNKFLKLVNYKFPFLKLGYYLYPYFGGNKVAPHDISLSLYFE